MTRLVDDLLDISRITNGKLKLQKERVQLRVIIDRAVETARPLVTARKHHLALSLSGEPVWLEADAARLEQVLANLLNNAAKYTEPGGDLQLIAASEGPSVEIRVRDTGIGIAPEMLPRIFDLYAQDARSLNRSQGGLGIGLTLVRSLVELHGGTVEAQSPGPGQGTEITVRLPVLAAPASQPPEVLEKLPESQPPLKILLVDDNVDTADSLSLLLRLWGHEVQVAPSGPTALELAGAFKPEVVLLDIGLPGMDGYQVARQIKEQSTEYRPLLIATTGFGQESDRQRATDVGFDHHLIKPVDPGKLHELLAALAQKRRK